MKIKVSLIALFTIAASSLHAAPITDDFNRANVAPTTNGSAIGTNWVIGSGTFELVSNRIRVNPTVSGTTMVSDSVMWNTGVTLSNGNFSASIDLFDVTNPRFGGLAVLVADSNSYLTLEVSETNAYAFRQNNNGVFTTIDSGTISYVDNMRLTISSSVLNQFTLNIVNPSSTVLLNKTVTFTPVVNSGFSGLYYRQTGGQYVWDNYSAVPEPSTLGLLALGCAALALRRRRR